MVEKVEGLLVEQRGNALWLVLNRPARRNALTLGMAAALASELEQISEETRCVVITGTPPAFCAGGDFDDLQRVARQGPAAVTDVVYGTFQRLVSAVATAPVPVVAGVSGPAMGGGFDLALWCDLRVASSRASFRSSWIRLGLVPGMGGAHVLTELVGSARAAELVMLGREIDAHVALAWGLVNEVVEPEVLDARLAELAVAISELPPVAMRRTKAALRRARDRDAGDELATLGAVQAVLATSEEFERATRGFRR